MPATDTNYSFLNYAGTYQLRLETAQDLRALELLKEPFWMATGAPLHQLQSDPKLLAFLDSDGNGRALSKDIRRVWSWLTTRLAKLNGVTAGSDTLRFADVDADKAEGERLLVAARHILRYLGKGDDNAITLEQVRNHQAERAKGFSNGDGVIVPASQADDAELQEFIKAIVDTMGGAEDLNGFKGVNREQLEGFLSAAQKLLDWQQHSRNSDEAVVLFPLGDDTAGAYELISGLREPLNDFFRLCRLWQLDDLMAAKNPEFSSPSDLLQDPAALDAHLADAPPAKPNSRAELNLEGPLNPHYQSALRRLAEDVLPTILGDDFSPERFDETHWQKVNEAFKAYEQWLQAKSGGEVEKLGPETLQKYLDSDLPMRLKELIEADEAVGKQMEAVKDLEMLILLQRWFLEIARNFVSFPNLYDPKKRALFELGQLVLSGRIFNLNIKVNDVAVHSKLAEKSGLMLLYSEVTAKSGDEKFFMVTPVTNISIGRISVEQHGVLFDRRGEEWDVRVIKMVDNPVSLWAEITKPFVRIGKVISASFQKLAGSAEKQIGSTVTQRVGKLETKVKSDMSEAIEKPSEAKTSELPAQPAAPPVRGSSAREWLFSGSVAVAALGSSLAFVTKTVKDLQWAEFLSILLIGLVVLVGIMFLVMIPLILIADYRLLHRNLGGLLEASGWAINAEMRVSRRLAKLLTPKPAPPAGIAKIRHDLTRRFANQAREASKLASSSLRQVTDATRPQS